ncbi:MAG: aminotransferase class III-fold pyridoxal phosphate-dependent enzyme [Vulcanimicrobiota bacterium]
MAVHVELSREMGDYLKNGLSQLKEKHQIMEEVRGRGLMTAVEFQKNICNEVIATIRSQLLQRGYILAMRPRLNVFRIDPPLIISKDDIDGFLKCFDQILAGTAS